MPYMLVHHRVKDYEKWKVGFDVNEADRRVSGSKGGYVLRNPSDHNDVWVMLEWEDEESLHAFAESEHLRQVMMDAGVVGEPDIEFLEEAARPAI